VNVKVEVQVVKFVVEEVEERGRVEEVERVVQTGTKTGMMVEVKIPAVHEDKKYLTISQMIL
jgi:hypothetical protein